MSYIMVRSTYPELDDGGNQVVLWELDRAHPDGEAFVAGFQPVSVGLTSRIQGLLDSGILELVRDEPEVDLSSAPAGSGESGPEKSGSTEQPETTSPPPPAGFDTALPIPDLVRSVSALAPQALRSSV